MPIHLLLTTLLLASSLPVALAQTRSPQPAQSERRLIALPLILNGEAPAMQVSASSLLFNDPVGGADSPARQLTISNSGNAPLTLNSLTLTGAAANSFGFGGGQTPPLPQTLTPGQNLRLDLVFKPAAEALGIGDAELLIAGNAPGQPTARVALRGLGSAGSSGNGEPSLQWVLDAHRIAVNVADNFPGNPVLGRQSGLLGDEVPMQRFVKAGPGPVSVEPLAVFGPGGAEPVTRLGWYRAGEPDGKTELLSIPASSAQSLNPQLNGTTSFDPGTAPFGLYSVWPFFKDGGEDRTVYSQDALNAFDPAVPHHVRVYPLKDASGTIQPNAFVVAFEEHNSDRDWQDLVLIIRNVTAPTVAPCSGNCQLTLRNLDGLPYDDLLTFSRINDPTPKDKDDDGDLTNNGPDAASHDRVTLRLGNSGNTPLEIAELTTSSFWRVDAPIILPTTIAPGKSLDVPIRFTATYRIPECDTSPRPTGLGCGGSTLHSGSLTIRSADPDTPTRTVELRGIWQDAVENSEPPLQLIFDAFGYTTLAISRTEQPFDGFYTARGEEVLSGQWERANSGRPVVVTQLAAYHGCCRDGDAESLRIGSSLKHNPLDSQSLLPRIYSQTTDLASRSFTPSGRFSISVGDYSSGFGASGLPHALRFYPAKDRNGAIIPDTYLVGQDYTANLKALPEDYNGVVNHDYQDNVYLISNIRPLGDGNANPAVLRRINVGGPDFVFDGQNWETDAGKGLFTPALAPAEDPAGELTIAGAQNQTLYQTYRGNVGQIAGANRTITYEIPVAATTVGVRLHFAELYWGRPGGGSCSGTCIDKRVFDISAEGGLLVDDFDIAAVAAGPLRASVLRFDNIRVSDGLLTLTLRASRDYPSISGIELLQ